MSLPKPRFSSVTINKPTSIAKITRELACTAWRIPAWFDSVMIFATVILKRGLFGVCLEKLRFQTHSAR